MVDPARLACVGEGGAGSTSGFTSGFTEFFRVEYPGLVRALFLLTADAGEAEELAQEAMARACERWDRIEAMESPGGYVYRTAVNLNRKRLRHLAVRARRLVGFSRHQLSGSPPEGELRSELAEALAALPVRLREAFMLVEWLGLDAEEAGRILGIQPSSVRSRLHRARFVLRERLRNEEEGDG